MARSPGAIVIAIAASLVFDLDPDPEPHECPDDTCAAWYDPTQLEPIHDLDGEERHPTARHLTLDHDCRANAGSRQEFLIRCTRVGGYIVVRGYGDEHEPIVTSYAAFEEPTAVAVGLPGSRDNVIGLACTAEGWCFAVMAEGTQASWWEFEEHVLATVRATLGPSLAQLTGVTASQVTRFNQAARLLVHPWLNRVYSDAEIAPRNKPTFSDRMISELLTEPDLGKRREKIAQMMTSGTATNDIDPNRIRLAPDPSFSSTGTSGEFLEQGDIMYVDEQLGTYTFSYDQKAGFRARIGVRPEHRGQGVGAHVAQLGRQRARTVPSSDGHARYVAFYEDVNAIVFSVLLAAEIANQTSIKDIDGFVKRMSDQIFRGPPLQPTSMGQLRQRLGFMWSGDEIALMHALVNKLVPFIPTAGRAISSGWTPEETALELWAQGPPRPVWFYRLRVRWMLPHGAIVQ